MRVLGFGVLGFWGFRVEGFRVLGFGGFRVSGRMVLGRLGSVLEVFWSGGLQVREEAPP